MRLKVKDGAVEALLKTGDLAIGGVDQIAS